MFGLKSAGDVTQNGSVAQVIVVSLEGEELFVQMDLRGVRIVSGGGNKDGLVCDSLNSLLLNASPGFVSKFNESLVEHLAAIAEERMGEDDQR